MKGDVYKPKKDLWYA